MHHSQGTRRKGGMFDNEGNRWSAIFHRWLDTLWQGNATKFDPQRQTAVAVHHRVHRWRVCKAAPSARPSTPTTNAWLPGYGGNRPPG